MFTCFTRARHTSTYLVVPSSLAALDDLTRLPVAGLLGLTETNRPDDEVFAGPRLERLRSFSNCFCLEASKDFNKL